MKATRGMRVAKNTFSWCWGDGAGGAAVRSRYVDIPATVALYKFTAERPLKFFEFCSDPIGSARRPPAKSVVGGGFGLW